jgi:hypothetical protein
LCFTNLAKRVCVGAPGGAEADLSLGVNASAEYGRRARKSQEEPWVHLLVQQDIEHPPSSVEFTTDSTHDGVWVTFVQGVLPLMCEGLAAGWQRGFLPSSRELADYRVTGVFIGWEVPGIFDVELQLRNLSLRATPKPSAAKPQ